MYLCQRSETLPYRDFKPQTQSIKYILWTWSHSHCILKMMKTITIQFSNDFDPSNHLWAICIRLKMKQEYKPS